MADEIKTFFENNPSIALICGTSVIAGLAGAIAYCVLGSSKTNKLDDDIDSNQTKKKKISSRKKKTSKIPLNKPFNAADFRADFTDSDSDDDEKSKKKSNAIKKSTRKKKNKTQLIDDDKQEEVSSSTSGSPTTAISGKKKSRKNKKNKKIPVSNSDFSESEYNSEENAEWETVSYRKRKPKSNTNSSSVNEVNASENE